MYVLSRERVTDAPGVTLRMETNIEMLLLEKDIPLYLHSSAYLQALLSEGSFPETGIEIPDGCLKVDFAVSAGQDLTELLHTLRFWLLPELLVSVDLLPFAFNIENKELIVRSAEEFHEVFPYLADISEIVCHDPQSRVECAVCHGHLNVVKFLVEVMHAQVTENAGVVASREGKVDTLEYLHSRGMKLSIAVCDAACTKGDLACVKYMINNNAAGMYHAMGICAANGHFECIRYVVQNLFSDYSNLPHIVDTAFDRAAANGHLECLKRMLKEWNDTMHVSTMAVAAAQNGHLPILKVAVESGVPIDHFGDAVEVAASRGHLHCLQYLRELGCPFTELTLEAAADGGDINVFRYLIDHNCPSAPVVCETLAGMNNLELLQYAREQGCPWDERTCAAAAERGHLACLQYAHEQGCPWSLANVVNDIENGMDVAATEEEEGIVAIEEHDQDQDESEDQGSGDEGESGSEYSGGEDAIWNDLEDENWELEHITRSAARAPTADCLVYVVQQGAVLDPSCGVVAARSKCVETLRLLHSQGFTWDEKACARAAAVGSLDCLRFLHDIGTPWDARTCRHAAYSAPSCLQYAHEHGCPWDKNTCKYAGNYECYEYAVKHGCPGAELSRFYKAQYIRAV